MQIDDAMKERLVNVLCHAEDVVAGKLEKVAAGDDHGDEGMLRALCVDIADVRDRLEYADDGKVVEALLKQDGTLSPLQRDVLAGWLERYNDHATPSAIYSAAANG